VTSQLSLGLQKLTLLKRAYSLRFCDTVPLGPGFLNTMRGPVQKVARDVVHVKKRRFSALDNRAGAEELAKMNSVNILEQGRFGILRMPESSRRGACCSAA
jgi:hypothetical protein